MKQKRIPLKGLKNFGPVTYSEFASMGFEFLDQIEVLGFEEACRKWVESYPERLNANAFICIACSLDGVIWTKATAQHRQKSHALVSLLRRELGRPAVKKSKKKRY